MFVGRKVPIGILFAYPEQFGDMLSDGRDSLREPEV